jgi:hypothetical protein
MNAILREASHEGFMKTLVFPNQSNWLVSPVPIWFGSCGILRKYCLFSNVLLFFLIIITKLLLFCILFIFSFRSVDAKIF